MFFPFKWQHFLPKSLGFLISFQIHSRFTSWLILCFLSLSEGFLSVVKQLTLISFLEDMKMSTGGVFSCFFFGEQNADAARK